MHNNSENEMTQFNIYCISNHVSSSSKKRSSEVSGNEMKNLENGRTARLITAERHATSPMPRVNFDTQVAHISLQFLHDDSLRASVSGPAVPNCCHSGSHGTSSN